ncbi:unnamed protein product, partial [Linum tenue]
RGHARAGLKLARPCAWPCKVDEGRIIDTVRFEGARPEWCCARPCTWPCNSGKSVLKPNSSQK